MAETHDGRRALALERGLGPLRIDSCDDTAVFHSEDVGFFRAALRCLLVFLLCVTAAVVGPLPGALAAPSATDDDPLGAPVEPVDVAEQQSRMAVAPPPSVPLTDRVGAATNLGTAAESDAVTGAVLDDTGAWVVTRSQVPAALYRWDRAKSSVVTRRDLPIGAGSWSLLQLGGEPRQGDVLVGTFTPGALVTYSPAQDKFTRTVPLGHDEIVMAMAPMADGSVAVGTYNPAGGRLLSYDPASGSVRTLAQWPDSRYVRSVVVVGDSIYAGLGTPASLWRWRNGTVRKVDTPALVGESMVYTLATDGASVFGGTEPGGRVFAVDSSGAEDFSVLTDTGGKTVDSMTVAGGLVHFTVRPQGALYSVDIAGADPPTLIGTPVYGAETRAIRAGSGAIDGMTGTAQLWRAGEDIHTTALTDHGAPTGPEGATQGVDFWGSEIVVGGHWRFQVHSADGAGSSVLRVPGEPKVTVSRGEHLYAAMYPNAEVHRLSGDSSELIARIPEEQMRPRAMIWHERSGRLVVSTRPAYGRYGGNLTIIHPTTGAVTSHSRPFGDHTVTAMADWGGDIIVGTETYGEAQGTAPGAGPAVVARWSTAGKVLWKSNIDGASMVTSVTQVKIGATSYILASSNLGTVALLDAGTGRVLWKSDRGGFVDQMSTVGERTLGRIDGRLHELHATRHGLSTVRLMDDYVLWVKPDPGDSERFAAVAPAVDGSPVLWRGDLKRAPRPERLGGQTRFETATEVSAVRFDRADTVVVVRHDEFADALAASPLASRLEAPILYTMPYALAAETRAEIDRLGARNVVIIGGPGAVSTQVEQALRSGGRNVSRVAGQDRYETAAAVAARIAALQGGTVASVLLVTGLDFPDGLSAGPAATTTGGVVLLTRGDTMPAATRSAVLTYRSASLYSVGGPAEHAASDAGLRPRARLTGTDRYETAVLVAQRWFSTADEQYLANGRNFADALVAAPAAGREKAPIVLTEAATLTPSSQTYIRHAAPDTVRIIGGSGVVSDRVWDQVRKTYL